MRSERTCPIFDTCTECQLCVEVSFCECHDCYVCGYVDCDGHELCEVCRNYIYPPGWHDCPGDDDEV